MLSDKPSIPSVAKQIKAQQILDDYKDAMLGSQLRDACANIDPLTLHREIVEFVPKSSMKTLQSLGIREETLFALPCVLKENPRLLGYYRLLLGISEKQFYTTSSGLSSYRTLEYDGKNKIISHEALSRLCRAINTASEIFLTNARKSRLAEDVRDLPILTLGVYIDGVWRNVVGKAAAQNVFGAIREVVLQVSTQTFNESERSFDFEVAGNRFNVSMGSDPDVSIRKTQPFQEKKVCIEIKGGQDVANVHNRAGEAEKSHQKASAENWLQKWTVVYYAGLTEEQRKTLTTESPTTDCWFDVNEICARVGDSFENFRNKILELLF